MTEEKQINLLGSSLEPTHVGMDLDSLPSGVIPYTMKNDFMFKAVLQKNLYALKGLLCALLSLKEEEIVAIEILNPIELGKVVTEKTCVLDIKLRLNNDTIINLEMQVLDMGNWPERSLTYLCRAFDNLQVGEDYTLVHNTIHIGILDYDLPHLTPELYAKYKMMNVKNHEIYSGKLDLRVLNLKCLDRMTKEELSEYSEQLMNWVHLFKAKTWEDIKMLAQNNQYIGETVFTIHEMTEEERIREECEAREKFNWDWTSSMQKSRREGIEEGRQDMLITLVKTKLEKGKDISQIASEIEQTEAYVLELMEKGKLN